MKEEAVFKALGTANPYSSYSDNTILEEIDTRFLIVCKRSLIASLSLQNGPAEDAMEKFESYQSSLGDYLLLVTDELYLPLSVRLKNDDKSADLRVLEQQNRHLNKRIAVFLQHPSEKVVEHRILFAYAIMRIDKLITQHHINERSVLYPLFSHTVSG